MASVPWRAGMPTRCGSCRAAELVYLEDGSARCEACGAVTAPAWATGPATKPDSSAQSVPSPPSGTGAGAAAPSVPSPPSRPLPGGNWMFYPGRASLRERALYLGIGGITLCLGVAIAWVNTVAGWGALDAFLTGALIGVGILLLAIAAVGRPVRWD